MWRASGLIVLDVDMMSEEGVAAAAEGRKPSKADHIALSSDALAAVELLAAQGGLPASAWHPTPRGLRLVRWMESGTTDAAVYRASAAAACAEAQAALAGVPGLVVDRGASCDLKRLMWGPRATVDGKPRSASVAVLRADPWAWTTPPAVVEPRRALKPEPPPRRPDEAPDTDIKAASARWNRDHAQEWPRRKERCPMCGTDDASPSWSAGDEQGRWSCFSSRHTIGGQRGKEAWHGDALDLAAALAGLRPYDVLVRDGYLRAPRAPTVSAPRARTSTAEALDRDATPAAGLRVIRGGAGASAADDAPIPFDVPAVTVGDVAADDFESRARGLRWPGSAWRVSDGGRIERKSAGMDAAATVSTAPIYVAGRSRDILTGEVVLVVRWRGASGWQELAIPRGEALDGRGLVKYAGQDLPVSSVSAKELVRWLAEFEAANLSALPTGRVSSSLGWVGRDGAGGYLWGSERIGGAGDGVGFRAPDAGEAQHADAMRRAGTLEGWQAAIAPMLALPAAMALWAVFAAPLLPLLGRTGCTVHLSGGGQGTGKSAACYAAMSAVGQPRAVSMGWRGTAVSHERRLALCGGGMPLYFDDTRECHPQEVLSVLMSVTNGRGKGRGSVSGTRADASWKTMLLSTGEEPATASATHGGEVARTIEVTELPWGTKGAKEGAQLVREVTMGTEEHYGHALPEFVRRVSEKYTADDLRSAWRALVADLSDDVRPRDGDFGYRLAEHRAVLVLAARLAYALGIVTAEPVEMAWASSEPKAGERSEEERARARIASWVASEAVRFVGSEAHAKAPISGGPVWGRWSEVDGTVAILSELLRERLREWKFSPDIALEGAARRGWIRRDGRDLTRKVAIEGRNRPRCYVWHIAELFD